MKTSDATEFLYGLPRFALAGEFAYRPGLDRMLMLMEAMDHPERAYPTTLVAGTNGKGSVASFLAAIATAAGRKTGLHTSPHLVHVEERLRIDGRSADSDWLASTIDRYSGVIASVGASFFEATTALALLYFAEREVDLAIVEVGLGGRFDATNILPASLSVITNVSHDHEEILGASLGEIAAEKAGIIKVGRPVVSGVEHTEAANVISSVAEDRGARMHLLSQDVRMAVEDDGRLTLHTRLASYPSVLPELMGRHQFRNAALAVQAAELTEELRPLDPQYVVAGLERVVELAGLRARLETVSEKPRIVVDVAHNDESLNAALTTCLEHFNRIDRLYLGLMKDKSIDEFAARLARLGIPVTLLKLESERALEPGNMSIFLVDTGVRLEGPALSPEEAYEAALRTLPDVATALMAGSHLVAGEVLNHVSSPHDRS